VVNTDTGEVIAEANTELTQREWQQIVESGVSTAELCFPERDDVGVVVSQTLKKDSVKTPRDAILEIYRKMRPAIRRLSLLRGTYSAGCSSTTQVRFFPCRAG